MFFVLYVVNATHWRCAMVFFISSRPMDSTSGVICPNCDVFVKYKICKTNRNGNRGRVYAGCTRIIDPITKERCSFFEFHPGSGPSSSPSPSVSQAETLPGPSQIPQMQIPRMPPPATSVPQQCPIAGCRSSRIRSDCTRRTCKTHCLSLGGCASKAHRVNPSNPSVPTQVPSGSQHVYAVLPPPTHPHPSVMPPPISQPITSLSNHQPPPPVIDPLLLEEPTVGHLSIIPPPLNTQPSIIPPPLNTQPSIIPPPLNTQPTTRHTSHMASVFNTQWQTEQEINEKKRRSDAARLADMNRSKHTIVVYAWTQDDTQPSVFEYQEGFEWPFFPISRQVLDDLGFAPEVPHVHVYRSSLETWNQIRVGHVVVADCDNRIFIKSILVARPLDVDRHTRRSIADLALHFRYNIAHERSVVRKQTKAQAKKPVIPYMEVSSEDEKRPESNLARTRIKRKRRQSSPQLLDVKTKHPRCKSPSPLPNEVIELSSDDSESQRTPARPIAFTQTPIKVERASPVLDTPVPASPMLDSPVPSSSKRLMWPRHFHVKAVVDFFVKSEDVDGAYIPHLFKQEFGVKYPRSTYFVTKNIWQSAPDVLKSAAYDAGFTSEGLWSTFSKKRRMHHSDSPSSTPFSV